MQRKLLVDAIHAESAEPVNAFNAPRSRGDGTKPICHHDPNADADAKSATAGAATAGFADATSAECHAADGHAAECHAEHVDSDATKHQSILN